jgi:hypothetical protein
MFAQTAVRGLSRSLGRLPKRRLSALLRHARNSARLSALRRVVSPREFNKTRWQ